MTDVDFTIKQGDTLSALQATLTDAAGPVDLTAATVRWHMRHATNGLVPTVDAVATVVDPAAGTVSYSWSAGDTATAGMYLGEWQVTFSGGAIATFPNWRDLKIRVVPQIA